MKKLFISLFSFILILAGGIFSANTLSSSAEGTEITEIKVYNNEELLAELSKASNYDNSSIKIILQDNIDFAGVDLAPISTLNGNFKGTFDGNGYSISNMTFKSDNQYFGLIPYATNATIQNVRVTGNINYDFNALNTKEIYAGVLVGFGENVIFKNCEFDSSSETNTINLPVYSDFNFGLLAGKIKGNPLANSSGNRANIRDCVNYYNFNVQLNKQANAYIGGFVGSMQNAFMLNVINFGNISVTNNVANGGDSSSLNSEYVGGLVGGIGGSGTQIRNTIFTGNITAENSSNLNLYKGAIIGGAISSGTSTQNINFCYFTNGSNSLSGDGFLSTSEKLKLIEEVSRTFLMDTTNFDEQSQNTPFDFDSVWSLTESKYHLQNFMSFSFSIRSVLHQTIKSAKFYVGEEEYSDTYTARYGAPVRIDVMLKEEYIGYYQLSGLSLSNIAFDMNKATVENIENESSQTIGYKITVNANATTSGSYSFSIQSVTYNCIATISDEAKATGQGGVGVAGTDATADEITLQFTYNSAVKKIVAEGVSTPKYYAFDSWKLYYKDENGDYSTIETPFENATDSELSISFGSAPFDREFKLVAYFTDADAILVSFGEINTKHIKSIKLGGIEYDGNAIPVSPNHAKNLEIVTAPNYKLDEKAFTDAIQKLYGNNSIETLVVAEPEENQEGETTYKYSINMRSIQEIDGKSLPLTLEIIESDANKNNNMLWLYILLPALGVIIIGVVVFIIIRRKRGGGSSGKAGSAVKPKKESYKDYY